jgi:hypothetical protein
MHITHFLSAQIKNSDLQDEGGPLIFVSPTTGGPPTMHYESWFKRLFGHILQTSKKNIYNRIGNVRAKSGYK